MPCGRLLTNDAASPLLKPFKLSGNNALPLLSGPVLLVSVLELLIEPALDVFEVSNKNFNLFLLIKVTVLTTKH